MVKEISCVIEAEDDGKQIRDIMRKHMELSDKQIRQAKFREHGICLNGESKYTTAVVAAGDQLVVLLEETVDSKIPSSYDELVWNPATGILYEDEDMIAVNKPAGVVSHPSPGHYNDSMASLLTGYYERKGTPMNLRCIGRLDKDTSGVLLFAKNQVAADRMSRQRINGTLKKEYLALAKGSFLEKMGTINMGITKIPGEIQARIDADGKPAVTHYEVEAETEEISLVRLRLETGRTHQIRLHLSWQGHPLLGDSWYGGDMLYGERAALHAEKMELIQPFTQEKIVLKVDLPDDMKRICEEYNLLRQMHELEPIYNEDSKILILGSFPSVKSREMKFYYGHPQNRFWKVLEKILDTEIPQTIEEKQDLLLNHHIALWDVIESCNIVGSSDTSIKNVVVNDLSRILNVANIQCIYANGGTAKKLYEKYIMRNTGREIVSLPSTSPANASFSVERLVDKWKVMKESLGLEVID